MRSLINRAIDILEQHFAVTILVIMFFGGAFLLAHYGLYEEMSRWIEGSPVVVAVVSLLKGPSPTATVIEPGKTATSTTTTSVIETADKTDKDKPQKENP